jgi:putative transposase
LSLQLSEAELLALESLVNKHQTPQQVLLRAWIVLFAAAGENNSRIADRLGVSLEMVRLWRSRWVTLQHLPLAECSVTERLSDLPRPGAPVQFTAEQMCRLMDLACEPPAASDRPITHWTSGELAAEAIQRGLFETISPRTVGRFLKRCRPQTAPEPVLAQPAADGAGGGA